MYTINTSIGLVCRTTGDPEVDAKRLDRERARVLNLASARIRAVKGSADTFIREWFDAFQAGAKEAGYWAIRGPDGIVCAPLDVRAVSVDGCTFTRPW